MKGVRFSIERSRIGGLTSVAYPEGDEPANEAIAQEVMACLGTDLQVTISGVTMFLAAWEDPDHWGTDWAEKLGIGYEDVPAAVAELLTQAIEET